MGFAHQFAIISQYSTESTISSDMDCVSVSDMVIQYIGDSLKWVHTMWNGKKFQEGISYYGYSVIENDEIIKLKNIIKRWVELFCLSPDEFYLTGDFFPDEEKYENVLVKREEIIKTLNSLIFICEKAINEEGKYYILVFKRFVWLF